jgi:hypothetical protein
MALQLVSWALSLSRPWLCSLVVSLVVCLYALTTVAKRLCEPKRTLALALQRLKALLRKVTGALMTRLKSRDKQTTAALLLCLMLLPLALTLQACTSNLPRTPLRIESAIPPLPQTARQPVTPSICLPTCSSALMKERGNWRNTLTQPALPASSVSATTTP